MVARFRVSLPGGKFGGTVGEKIRSTSPTARPTGGMGWPLPLRSTLTFDCFALSFAFVAGLAGGLAVVEGCCSAECDCDDVVGFGGSVGAAVVADLAGSFVAFEDCGSPLFVFA